MAPSGGSAFNGTGFSNSGMVMPGQSYSLKFTKAGSYAYECYLHSGSKMTGSVVVVSKNAVKMIVNGKALADSAKAEWKNGALYVSLDSFVKALGGKVTKDAKSQAAVAAYVSAEEIVRMLGGCYMWNQATTTLTVTVGDTGGDVTHIER